MSPSQSASHLPFGGDGQDHPTRVLPRPAPRRLTICERCWTVIAIDGENNVRREPQMCAHLGPFVNAVTT